MFAAFIYEIQYHACRYPSSGKVCTLTRPIRAYFLTIDWQDQPLSAVAVVMKIANIAQNDAGLCIFASVLSI